MREKRGFTLIELMVVIVILGILSAVIAPRIPRFIVRAKEGKTKGNLASLRAAANIYYSDNEGLYPRGTSGPDINLSFLKYLKEIPQAEMPPHHASSNDGRLGTDGAINEDGGWWYQNDDTASDWGDVAINCAAHLDSGNTAWSSY